MTTWLDPLDAPRCDSCGLPTHQPPSTFKTYAALGDRSVVVCRCGEEAA